MPNDNGTYTVTYTLVDDDGGTTSDTAVVTVLNVAPIVVSSPATQSIQYSDQITTITIQGSDLTSDSLSAAVSWNKDGGDSPGLPDAVTITGGLAFAGTGGAGTGTWTIGGIATFRPARTSSV